MFQVTWASAEEGQKDMKGVKHAPPDEAAPWPVLLSTNRIFLAPSASLDFFQNSLNEGRVSAMTARSFTFFPAWPSFNRASRVSSGVLRKSDAAGPEYLPRYLTIRVLPNAKVVSNSQIPSES